MSFKTSGSILAVLSMVAILAAGCYSNPAPAGLTPIPTLGAEPTAAAVAIATAAQLEVSAATAAAGTVATAQAQPSPAAVAQASPAATAGSAAVQPAAGATAAAAPAAGAAQGNAQNGQTVFTTNCAPCHGADAGGGVGPALKNNNFVKTGGDKVFQTIANGRPGTAMPAWKGKLTDAQINDVIAYLMTLQK